MPVIRIDSAPVSRQVARRNRLVEAHLYLVEPIARAIVAGLPPSFESDDLIQAGHLGLIDAAAKYRPRAHGNTPFSAYARYRIRGAILSSIRRRNYTDATQPSIDDVPERAGHAGIEEAIDRKRKRLKVTRSLEDLDERHRKVVVLHYQRDAGLAEVGSALGVCPSRASQLHVESLKKLKKSLDLRDLPEAEAA